MPRLPLESILSLLTLPIEKSIYPPVGEFRYVFVPSPAKENTLVLMLLANDIAAAAAFTVRSPIRIFEFCWEMVSFEEGVVVPMPTLPLSKMVKSAELEESAV